MNTHARRLNRRTLAPFAACAAAAMLVTAYGIGLATRADEPRPPVPAPVPAPAPCDDALHHQFDFWIGEWQAYDVATSQLMAIDRIENDYRGCVVI